MKNLKLQKESEQECKGLVFRARVASFMYPDRTGVRLENIMARKTLNFLKTLSCPGCQKCQGSWEVIQEDLANLFPGEDFLKDIEDGHLYRLKVTWYPGPYEYPDDGEVEIDFVDIGR